ncbi:5922_t:CDS:2 [Funneliformis geosporum]|uniref:4779_t:CDS:1 n=1 Tax=Funneliformis geosporum TaxID=1117311 RepID=A0A9W4T1T7_9GLOM|nr:4779_t:CDS:2 [Funneliformis geosporum]CAI2187504.1 5922_t:CDS:2 [Funneliformis geosporum]
MPVNPNQLAVGKNIRFRSNGQIHGGKIQKIDGKNITVFDNTYKKDVDIDLDDIIEVL